MKRRDVIKGLSVLPFAGGALSAIPASAASAASELMYNGEKLDYYSTPAMAPGPLSIGPNVYQSIGVQPIINCRGTFTILGASIMLPEARKAMEYAHQINTQLDELAFGVGQRLAEITGAEYGVVSSGCAGGMKIVTCGILSGGDPEKLAAIPMHTLNLEKHEVVLLSSSHYDHSIRVLGVKYHRADNLQELEDAMNEKTAMVYFGSTTGRGPNGPFTVADVAKICKAKNVPLLVDAAADKLTIPNEYLQMGADVVAYSGGKIMCGPQSAGLMLGNKKILQAAWQASAPHHGPCRDNKVGREEQIGMLAAVESWATRNHDDDTKLWVSWLKTIQNRVAGIPGVVTNITIPPATQKSNASPALNVTWDPTKNNLTGLMAGEEMVMTTPRVAATGRDGGPGAFAGGRGGRGAAGATAAAGAAGAAPAAPAGPSADQVAKGATNNPVPAANTASLNFVAYMMGEGNAKVVADKLYGMLTKQRPPIQAAAAMAAPVANMTGRWNLTVEYFNSTSQQAFIIEKQDGNFMQGTHKGSMSTRDMRGTIDGNKIVFYSHHTPEGDDGRIDSSINLTFYGTIDGDNISGDIDMGEYITAKFTGKRHTYPENRQKINVPQYRPLSS